MRIRPLVRLLWTANVMLLAVMFGLWLFGQADTRLTLSAGSWSSWMSMSRGEQLMYVQQYRQLQRRPDAGTTLRRARLFSQLPADEQEQLRSVARLLRSTIQAQPPAVRRDLLLAPEGARAYRVYQLLRVAEAESGVPTTQTQPAAP